MPGYIDYYQVAVYYSYINLYYSRIICRSSYMYQYMYMYRTYMHLYTMDMC